MEMLRTIRDRPCERTIVLCVAAVQFVNILDFMIVMPRRPEFAKALAIPLSNEAVSEHFGLVVRPFDLR